MPRRILLAALLAAAPARATPLAEPTRACEAFVDPREIRYRTPDRVVTGRIVAGSVKEPALDKLEIGQQFVVGQADLADIDGGPPLRVSYIYLSTARGCDGWEPARGGRYLFDLIDDRARDGTMRVMRYVAAR